MASRTIESLSPAARDFINEHTEIDLEVSGMEECPICLENYTSEQSARIRGITGCSHLIGFNCLKRMLCNDPHLSKKCPLCRTQWIAAPFIPIIQGSTGRVIDRHDVRARLNAIRETLMAAREREVRAIEFARAEREFLRQPAVAGDNLNTTYQHQLQDYNDFRRDVQDIRNRARSARPRTRSFMRRNAATEATANDQTGNDNTTSHYYHNRFMSLWRTPRSPQRQVLNVETQQLRGEAARTRITAPSSNSTTDDAAAQRTVDGAQPRLTEEPTSLYIPQERFTISADNTSTQPSDARPNIESHQSAYSTHTGTISNAPAADPADPDLTLNFATSDDPDSPTPTSGRVPRPPHSPPPHPQTPAQEAAEGEQGESTTPPTTPPHLRVRSTLSHERVRLTTLHTSLAHRERDLSIREASLRAREQAIASRETNLTSREQTTLSREVEVAGRETRVLERENQVLAREARIEMVEQRVERIQGRVRRVTNMVVAHADEARALLQRQQEEITRAFGEDPTV